MGGHCASLKLVVGAHCASFDQGAGGRCTLTKLVEGDAQTKLVDRALM